MSYTPTNWQTGDTITAEKLNKMEQGIAGAGGCLVVNAMFNKTKTEEIGYEFFFDCDKPMSEISAAYLAGQNIRVLLYSEWAKNDSEEYVHLDTARFCKGLDVWTTYSNSADMLILVDEYSSQCFLSSATGITTAQVEAQSDYLPRAD